MDNQALVPPTLSRSSSTRRHPKVYRYLSDGLRVARHQTLVLCKPILSLGLVKGTDPLDRSLNETICYFEILPYLIESEGINHYFLLNITYRVLR